MVALDFPTGGGYGPRRALVYARTGPLASGRPAVDLQLAAAAAHARLNGFEPVGDAVDEGISGGVQPFSRPGLGLALTTLAAGEAEALAVASLDRISNDAAMATMLADCSRHDGWRLLVPGVADCSTPVGHFVVTVLCALTRLTDTAARTQDLVGENGGLVIAGAVPAPQPGFPTPVPIPVPPPDPMQHPGHGGASAPLPAAPVPDSAVQLPGSYLDVWLRVLWEHGDGFPVARIAQGLNDDGMPLPVGLLAEGHAEWNQTSVSWLVEWPQGADLLNRAMTEGEQGRTPEQIARGFNDDGMPTRRGRTWSASTVTALLDGNTYD